MHRKRKIALIMAAVLVIAGVGIYGGKSILKKAHPSSLKRRRPQKVKGRIQESLKTAVYYRLGALHPVELTISYII